MTYADLLQQIQDYVQTSEPTFLSNVDTIILLAEQRINRDAKSPDSRASIAGTVSSQLITTPSDFVMPLSLFVNVNSTQTGLLLKEPSYLTEAFGTTASSAGSTGNPAYYAIQKSGDTSTTLLVSPAPSSPMSYTLYYYKTVDSITSNGPSTTTWISNYFPQVLLYGCLVEAYSFLKGDQQMQAQYEKLYQLGLLELKAVVEDDQRMDNYRNPDNRRNIG